MCEYQVGIQQIIFGVLNYFGLGPAAGSNVYTARTGKQRHGRSGADGSVIAQNQPH